MTIFTQDFGKLKILGKAIRKITSKLRASVSLFSLSEIEFIQGKFYKTLIDAALIDDFKNLKKDLKRLKIAHQISEIADILLRGQKKDKKIWRLLDEVFYQLDNYSLPVTHYSLPYLYFSWNLLSVLGYRPELYQCLICGAKLKPQNLYFSRRGGLVCSSCFQNKNLEVLKVNVNAVKFLREVLKKDFSHLSKIKVKKEHFFSLKEILDFYLSFIASDR